MESDSASYMPTPHKTKLKRPEDQLLLLLALALLVAALSHLQKWSILVGETSHLEETQKGSSKERKRELLGRAMYC